MFQGVILDTSDNSFDPQGTDTTATIRYNILPTGVTPAFTPDSVTLKIKQGTTEVNSLSLPTASGEQEATWDGKNSSQAFVGTGTYEITLEVTAGDNTHTSNVHQIVVVDEIFVRYADAEKRSLDRLLDATNTATLRPIWNGIDAVLPAQDVETASDNSIAASTTIPSTTLLDKILHPPIAHKETTLQPLQLGRAGEFGITQIRDVVMSDRGKTHQDDVAEDLVALTTIVGLGEYLNTLLTDGRAGVRSCFDVTIDQMEWLDNNYIDTSRRANYQLGDNKTSTQMLAVGWNGGHSKITAGFVWEKKVKDDVVVWEENEESTTWFFEGVKAPDLGAAGVNAYNYANDIANRAYPNSQ